MKRTPSIALPWLLFLTACQADAVDTANDTDVPPPSFCKQGPVYLYDPDPNVLFTTFPDDIWTVEDATRTSGRRLAVGTDEYPGTADFAPNLVENFDHAATLDGFGRTTPVVFQFNQDVSGQITADDVVLLANGTPQALTLRFEDFGYSVFLEPLTPLPPAATVVAGIFGHDDACIVPSIALRQQLTTDDSPHAARVRAGLEATGRDIDDVGALTVYTTHTADNIAIEAATFIESQSYALTEDPACLVRDGMRVCEARLPVDDLRDAEGVIPVEPIRARGGYDLPLRVWLPLGVDGPVPVVVCGHGLGGDKSQCEDLGRRATPLGVAVIAPDAIEHGEHPSQTDTGLDALNRVSIFAIRVLPPGIHGLRLRDNFHQAAFDKLMLVQAIRQGMDVDGDGDDDFDPSRMAYVGASLGGIMGVEPATLTDAFGAVALIVAGGQLTRIISDSDAFEDATALIAPADWSEGELARAFPLLQMAMDGADPAVFAPHLATDRLRDDHNPHVLLLLAENDDVVPNSSNDALARALNLPGLGPELWSIEGIPFGAATLSANLPSGATGAVVQFREVTNGTTVGRAEHGNLHTSEEAAVLIQTLFLSVRDGTTPILEAP